MKPSRSLCEMHEQPFGHLGSVPPCSGEPKESKKKGWVQVCWFKQKQKDILCPAQLPKSKVFSSTWKKYPVYIQGDIRKAAKELERI